MPISPVSSQGLWPSRKWCLILGLIFISGAVLRYTGYNFGLPYIDHPDEPAYNLAGRMIIDFGSAKPLGMQGYPPGIVELNYVILRFLQKPNTPPGSILWIVRLVSVTFSVMVLVMVTLLTFRIATPMAALFAAAFWGFSPHIIEASRYATPDNFVTFFTLLAFFLVITELDTTSIIGFMRAVLRAVLPRFLSIRLHLCYQYLSHFLCCGSGNQTSIDGAF